MKKSYVFGMLILSVLLMGTVCCKKSGNTTKPKPEEPGTDTGTGQYETTDEIFPNPERGFIRTFSIYSEGQPLQVTQLKQLRNEHTSLILFVFYFDKFKDKPVSDTELELIETNLNRVREAGLKAILRFAYTDAIGGATGADAPLNIVEQHLDQLKPLFAAHKDVIAYMQAGFIGAWGEWHSSSNGLTTTENQRAVLLKILSVLPQEIMVQIRTPLMKQHIFNTSAPITQDIAFSTENRARVGHHNDCFLSGGTDYGTYTDVNAEKKYISDEAAFVPTGGETCPPTDNYSPNCREGQREMKLLKWTYLNLDWYPETINAWKTSGCFDDFQRNLGYRLALESAELPETAAQNGDIKAVITIRNTGFAPMYHKKALFLVFKNQSSGQFYEKAITADIRQCKPDGTQTINQTVSANGLPAGKYDAYLKIADDTEALRTRIEYSVRLANKNTWTTDNGGMNKLNLELSISGN